MLAKSEKIPPKDFHRDALVKSIGNLHVASEVTNHATVMAAARSTCPFAAPHHKAHLHGDHLDDMAHANNTLVTQLHNRGQVADTRVPRALLWPQRARP
jgi:hypothetical protein